MTPTDPKAKDERLIAQLLDAKRDCGLANYTGTFEHKFALPQVLKNAELALGAAVAALQQKAEPVRDNRAEQYAARCLALAAEFPDCQSDHCPDDFGRCFCKLKQIDAGMHSQQKAPESITQQPLPHTPEPLTDGVNSGVEAVAKLLNEVLRVSSEQTPDQRIWYSVNDVSLRFMDIRKFCASVAIKARIQEIGNGRA